MALNAHSVSTPQLRGGSVEKARLYLNTSGTRLSSGPGF